MAPVPSPLSSPAASLGCCVHPVSAEACVSWRYEDAARKCRLGLWLTQQVSSKWEEEEEEEEEEWEVRGGSAARLLQPSPTHLT